MLNLVELIDEAKARKIRNYPCHVNRASSIGHPCDRFLVLSRTHWQDKKLHDVGLQRVFDLGNLFERAVMDDLKDAGLYLEEQQSPFHDPRYQLSGRIDGKLPLNGRRYPVEIKSMSPFTWEKINTWQDFLAAKYPYLRSYPYQMASYLFLHGEEEGIMLLVNKVSGAIKQLMVPLDYDLAEEVLQKCERVNAHVAQGTLPDPIEWEDPVCGQCGFLTICYPERDFGPGMEVLDDSELEAMLDKRARLAGAAKEYDEVDKAVKAAVKEKPHLLIGHWEIMGKWVSRKGFTVTDSQYWQSKIRIVN